MVAERKDRWTNLAVPLNTSFTLENNENHRIRIKQNSSHSHELHSERKARGNKLFDTRVPLLYHFTPFKFEVATLNMFYEKRVSTELYFEEYGG